MTIRTRVIGGVLVVLALSGSVAFYSYSRSRLTYGRLALVNDLFLPLSRQITQLHGETLILVEDLRRFYFRGDGSPTSSTNTRVARDIYPYVILKRIESIDALLEKNRARAQGSFVSDLEAQTAKARRTFERLLAQRKEEDFERGFGDLLRTLDLLVQRVDEESHRVTVAAQGDGQGSLLSGWILSLAALFGGVASLVLSNRALQALPQLSASLEKIADGDFTQGLKVRTGGKDEVSDLARQFNRMLSALRERDGRIQDQQKELLQHERLAAIGQLSAEIVHEIRNPLNAISLNIDWLQSEIQGQGSEIHRTLGSISREVERLHQITESYLVRARVTPGEPTTTELNSLIREILEFSREEDKSHRISVVCQLSDRQLHVRCERPRMKQALLNILRNAKEAMPQGGTLTVSTENDSNVHRIRIEDTGYGMNENTRRRTFQPFFTTKTNGTGLGLLLTREIIEEARGSIDCKSELGKGTSFTLQFPA